MPVADAVGDGVGVADAEGEPVVLPLRDALGVVEGEAPFVREGVGLADVVPLALRVGERAVSSQGRKVSVGVANCLQGRAMEEEMIARILSLQLTYTTCARGGVYIYCTYGQSVEPGLSQQLPALECRHPEVCCHSEPLGVGVGCC